MGKQATELKPTKRALGGETDLTTTPENPQETAEFTKVVIKHWRVVNDSGGIVFSVSDHDDHCYRPEQAEERARHWAEEYGSAYHIEQWEQSYLVGPSTWKQVDGGSEKGPRQ